MWWSFPPFKCTSLCFLTSFDDKKIRSIDTDCDLFDYTRLRKGNVRVRSPKDPAADVIQLDDS